MVEFLVEHGADVNRGDNEGWTPLHATASCGFLSIAKYLIEHGANVAAVNHDGQLAVDIAESDEMDDLLKAEIKEQGKTEMWYFEASFKWNSKVLTAKLPETKKKE